MKKITYFSSALIMSSLFSIPYLIMSVSAEDNPGMPPTAAAPGMPPTAAAPEGGISGWIKGGLKALGIGSDPDKPTGAAPATGDISHCAQFSGPPKAACEAAASAPQPKAGDISHCAQFSGPPKAACEAAAAGK